MTNPTNNVNNICPTCNDRDLGFDGTCIICFEANSCVKHKELRDPIAGCNSCLNESQVFVAKPARLSITLPVVSACIVCGELAEGETHHHICSHCHEEAESIDWDNVGGSHEVPDFDLTAEETDIPLEEAYQVTTCEKCKRYGVHEDSPICSECRETLQAEHMALQRAQAARTFEGKTKLQAIEFLCAYANGNCLAMHETWLYQFGAEIYGITRADYYNDYDEITESAREFGIGDNWKPLTENHLVRLKADLTRESAFNPTNTLMKDIDAERAHSLHHYTHQLRMIADLIEAIGQYLPPTGGRRIWEL